MNKDDNPTKGPRSNDKSNNKPGEKPENKGELLLDATCTPVDIRFPTDMRLLNEVREKLEDIIDTLHEPDIDKSTKPRAYRKEARKNQLSLEKQR